MPINTSGIWTYTENDPVSPFSDFLNLLGHSVSDVVDDIRSDVAALDVALDGAAAFCTVSAGWAQTDANAHRPRVRTLGPMILLQGAVTRLASPVGAATSLLTVPVGFRPGPSPSGTTFIGTTAWSTGGGAGGVAPLAIDPATGIVSIPSGYGTGALGASSVVPVAAMWWR